MNDSTCQDMKVLPKLVSGLYLFDALVSDLTQNIRRQTSYNTKTVITSKIPLHVPTQHV